MPGKCGDAGVEDVLGCTELLPPEPGGRHAAFARRMRGRSLRHGARAERVQARLTRARGTRQPPPMDHGPSGVCPRRPVPMPDPAANAAGCVYQPGQWASMPLPPPGC